MGGGDADRTPSKYSVNILASAGNSVNASKKEVIEPADSFLRQKIMFD